MIEKTPAIVLSKIKYSDNSYIVNFYSLIFGKFASIVKIPKNKKAGNINTNTLFPLSIVSLGVIFKKTRNIQTLKYCSQDYLTIDINNNIYKSCIAQFIAEIIMKSVKEEETNETLYYCIKDAIIKLEKSTKNISINHILFLRNFAKVSGFEMSRNYCEETPFFNLREGMFLPIYTCEIESLDKEESKILLSLLNSDDNCEELNFPPRVRQMLLDSLIKYYKFHFAINTEIKTLKIFKEVFN